MGRGGEDTPQTSKGHGTSVTTATGGGIGMVSSTGVFTTADNTGLSGMGGTMMGGTMMGRPNLGGGPGRTGGVIGGHKPPTVLPLQMASTTGAGYVIIIILLLLLLLLLLSERAERAKRSL